MKREDVSKKRGNSELFDGHFFSPSTTTQVPWVARKVNSPYDEPLTTLSNALAFKSKNLIPRYCCYHVLLSQPVFKLHRRKEAYQAKELSIPHYILIVGDYALKQENEISFLHEREIYRTLIIMRRTQPLIGHMHAYCLPSMTFCRLLVSKFVDRLCEGGTSVTFLNENQ